MFLTLYKIYGGVFMKKLKLKLAKAKFELQKIILGILYFGIFLSPFMALHGEFNLKHFIVWLSSTAILTIHYKSLYGNCTKCYEFVSS